MNVFLSVTHGTSEPAKFLEMYVLIFIFHYSPILPHFRMLTSISSVIVTIKVPPTNPLPRLHLLERVSLSTQEESA